MRQPGGDPSTYAFGPFVLDCTKRQLLRGGNAVGVTPKAFDILVLLARNGGRVVDKETLLHTAWPDTVVDEGSLTFQISTLRKLLGDSPAGDRYIATVPGRGYQLAAAVDTQMLIEERTTTIINIEERSLINRRRLIAAFAVIAAVAMATAVLTRRSPVAVPPIRSIAVLPFKPLVANQRDEAVELGMADTLIARISSIRGVTVRPLSAVRRFTGLEQDAVAAGRQLGVDAVLDGSIHHNGDKVRVTARLLRVADATQLWEGRFDATFADIFSVHDAISSKLVEELSFNLSAQERRQLQKKDTSNREAYRAFLLGRYHMAIPRRDNYEKAIQYFDRAIELDPDYANAYAYLAESYGTLPIGCDYLSGPSEDNARRAANKAIALDPENGEAYTTLGFEKFWYEWDWSGAEQQMRRGVSLNPTNPDARRRYAHLLSNTGRHAEALREVAEAERLDPMSLLTGAMKGQFLVHAGQIDAGIEAYRHTLEINPDFWIARLSLGKAYEQKAMFDQALEEYRHSWAHSLGSTEPLGRYGRVLALRGRDKQARSVLRELLDLSKERYVPPYNIAMVYVGLGDNDRAIDLMRRACRERDVRMTFLKVEPLWNALRSDPRFAEIDRCVGLPRNSE